MKKKVLAITLATVLALSLGLVLAGPVGASPGLVGYWPFEEGSGTTTSDASGNGNNGTLKPAASEPTWTTDSAFGTYALNFDGDNDFVEIANESNFDFDWDDAFAIEAWVKTESDAILNIVTKMDNDSPNTGYQLIKHQSTQGVYDSGGGNKLYFFLVDTYNTAMIVVYGSTDITDGSYHHVLVTYDGSGTDSGVQIYVDGSLETMHTRGSWNSLSGSDSILNDLPLQISGREGSPYAWDGCIDEVRVWDTEFPSYTVDVDIKPTSCPNPLNVKSKGVLPVAILGTEDFDVTEIDPTTVMLEGVSPLRSAIEDVATPYGDTPEDCDDCSTEGPDGYMDLTLKFNKQEIVAALGDVDDGDCLELELTGNLKVEFGGTAIAGVDVVWILKKGKK